MPTPVEMLLSRSGKTLHLSLLILEKKGYHFLKKKTIVKKKYHGSLQHFNDGREELFEERKEGKIVHTQAYMYIDIYKK